RNSIDCLLASFIVDDVMQVRAILPQALLCYKTVAVQSDITAKGECLARKTHDARRCIIYSCCGAGGRTAHHGRLRDTRYAKLPGQHYRRTLSLDDCRYWHTVLAGLGGRDISGVGRH